ANIRYYLNQTIAVPPFIIVPSDNFQHSAAYYGGQFQVNNRRVAVADKITRHELFFGYGEYALVIRLFGSRFNRLIDFFNRYRALGNENKIAERYHRCGHSDAHTTEYSLQRRQGLGGGNRSTGGSRDDILGRIPCLPEVFGRGILEA